MESIPQTWSDLCERLTRQMGMEVDLNGLLFLVGIRERGLTIQKFTKEEKLNLIHLGSCTLFLEMGWTEKIGEDEQGWPQFRQKDLLPTLTEEAKKRALQQGALIYFGRIYSEG